MAVERHGDLTHCSVEWLPNHVIALEALSPLGFADPEQTDLSSLLSYSYASFTRNE